MVLSFASWVLAEADVLLFRSWVTGNNRLWRVFFSSWVDSCCVPGATLSLREWLFVSSVLWERQKMLFSSVYPLLRRDSGASRVPYSAAGRFCPSKTRQNTRENEAAQQLASPQPINLFFLVFFWEENDTSEWHICFGVLRLLGCCAAEPCCSFATHSIALWRCLYFCRSPSLAFACSNLRFQQPSVYFPFVEFNWLRMPFGCSASLLKVLTSWLPWLSAAVVFVCL